MPAAAQPFISVFQQTFDVAIFGAGYAGFAASRVLAESGKSILLIDSQAALLWESGWAFEAPTGTSQSPAWQAWLRELVARGAAKDGLADGAIAEVLATCALSSASNVRILYYAMPMAIERDGVLLTSVVLGTKAGLRRVVARQWIDATEEGQLQRLVDPGFTPRVAASQTLNLFYRNEAWAQPAAGTAIPADFHALRSLSWHSSVWPNERRLRIELAGKEARTRAAWVPALEALRAAVPGDLDTAILTHGSVIPYPVYESIGGTRSDCSNLALAIAGAAETPIRTLAERFDLGLSAVRTLQESRLASANEALLAAPLPPIVPTRMERSAIAVAGTGTGGGLAAVAAAREGQSVFAFDPLPYAGGIGAGGGIHWYYFGVRGGLQDELDERVKRIMPLFGKTAQLRSFHPDAKKIAIEDMLYEAGARVVQGMLVNVSCKGSRVVSALIGTPQGPLNVEAAAWIDATGDGDLAARAGAEFFYGRMGDGQVHAFSQSSGRATVKDGAAQLQIINFDAGFTDPTDSEDLTRARLLGIGQYLQERYAAVERPTYIAPAIGLRQARHIKARYMLTLADLVEHRRFEDSVGLTGCHYDNHAIDYEFESDESVFWVWVCRLWKTGRTACEIPYRMLLPESLDNVWIACRAAGVTQDAHHSFRMQRDMQRIGEVSGVAAALAVREQCGSAAVPLAALREKLAATGAVKIDERVEESFGPHVRGELFAAEAQVDLDACLASLEKFECGNELWRLYRARKQSHERIQPLLLSANPTESWHAAALLAMFGDVRAENRLCEAVTSREYGFDGAVEDARPEHNRRVATRWMTAVALLRICGTPASLPALKYIADHPELPFNARTTIALTLQRIADRHPFDGAERDAAAAILDHLLNGEAPNEVGNPQRNPLVKAASTAVPSDPLARQPVIEDFRWQLQYAVESARLALDLPLQSDAVAYLNDARLPVRRAFATLLASAPAAASAR